MLQNVSLLETESLQLVNMKLSGQGWVPNSKDWCCYSRGTWRHTCTQENSTWRLELRCYKPRKEKLGQCPGTDFSPGPSEAFASLRTSAAIHTSDNINFKFYTIMLVLVKIFIIYKFPIYWLRDGKQNWLYMCMACPCADHTQIYIHVFTYIYF